MPTTSPIAPAADPAATLSPSPQDAMREGSTGAVQTGEPLSDESDEGDYFIRQGDLDRACLQRGRG